MAEVMASEASVLSVTLKLTGEEAEALRDIFYRVGGVPSVEKQFPSGTRQAKEPSRRALTDAIDEALKQAGVPQNTRGDIAGNIQFT